MAKLEVTPTDELTGLPLPLVPLDDYNEETNWHHHFHPKKSAILKSGTGGLAVRQSRLQLYDIGLHNEYHHNFEGPTLPRTREKQFAATVMAIAGYMPAQAIDLRGESPRIVDLSHKDRRRLQASGEMRLGTEALIKRFIKEYVLSRGISAIDTSELAVEEFVMTTDEERRLELGHNLLGIVISQAAEPANEMYYQAKKKELIKPGLAGNVQKFVKAKLGPRRTRDKIVDSLYDRLATS